ncbi:MAG: anti-sigma factor antagonist [Chlamydiia bacterium]|nr:anti-sigma factor antagonist [Chlamydiia bacterium]
MLNPEIQQLTNSKELFNEDAKPSVLIIDDDPKTLDALEMSLDEVDAEIYRASSGREAVETLKNRPISVIVCDLGLPDTTGLEVLKEAIHIQPDAIRIALTGNADLHTTAELVNAAHISHFILKPWDYQTFLQTVRSGIEQVRLTLENRRLTQMTQEQNKLLARVNSSLKEELVIGGHIQNLLLRGKHPERLQAFELETLSIPSKEIDGDFYDIYQPVPHLVDIVLGDVMGKGLPAALVGTAVKSQLSRFAIPVDHSQVYDRVSGWHRDIFGPHQILQRVHQELIEPLENLEHFVSLFYGRFDLKKRLFSYVDCGSTKPIHFRSSDGITTHLKGSNFPLGISRKDSFKLYETPFEEADVFLFYSDGVTEARSPEGELYGIERLDALLLENIQLSAKEIVRRIHQALIEFTKDQAFSDDFSLMLFKVESVPGAYVDIDQHIAKFNSDLSQLKAVRTFIDNFCLEITQHHKQISEPLSLAVNEAFCNVVKHGYRGQSGSQILLQAEVRGDEATVELLDQGISFDPQVIQHPSFAGDKDDGFGFFLIKAVSDRVTYIRKKTESGWNCMRITKKFNLEEESMDISNYNNEGILVIKLEGESLDAKEAPEFKKRIMDLIDQEGTSKVVFDLSKLTFIDSTGLGSFLSILRSLNGMHGDLRLACMTRSIHAIFELVCMNKIFEIYATVDEALEAYQKSAVSKTSQRGG